MRQWKIRQRSIYIRSKSYLIVVVEIKSWSRRIYNKFLVAIYRSAHEHAIEDGRGVDIVQGKVV